MFSAAKSELRGFPEGTWRGSPIETRYDEVTGAFTIVAGSITDWCVDAITAKRSDSAPALLHKVVGDVALSARVHVGFHSTFDAGGLCAKTSDDCWAKLCFERSPAGERMIVSIVTDGVSDDANSSIINADEVYLRLSRFGDAYAFHYSIDGVFWTFVRAFKLRSGATAALGFFGQSPQGAKCTVVFHDLNIGPVPLHDLRDGT